MYERIGKVLEDEKLVKDCLGGNAEAFGKIYERYKDRLYSCVIFPTLMDREAAEEVLQETFLTALKKIGTFKWKGVGLFAWLRKIALLKCKEYKRKCFMGNVIEYIDELSTPESQFSEGPDKEINHREFLSILKKQIETTLGLINQRYREVIELRIKHNRTREECSSTMNISVPHFDVLFFRACKSFKEKYQSLYGTRREEK